MNIVTTMKIVSNLEEKKTLIRHALAIEGELERGHEPDFETTMTIDREPDETKRKFIEACYI